MTYIYYSTTDVHFSQRNIRSNKNNFLKIEKKQLELENGQKKKQIFKKHIKKYEIRWNTFWDQNESVKDNSTILCKHIIWKNVIHSYLGRYELLEKHGCVAKKKKITVVFA